VETDHTRLDGSQLALRKIAFPMLDVAGEVTGFIEMIQDTKFNDKKMHMAARGGFTTATDIAEYLVGKGMPFRRAHEITGKIVAYCLQNKKELENLSLKEYQNFDKCFAEDIRHKTKVESAVNSRKHTGGTATKTVMQRIKEFEKSIVKI
jgi:argininosuccinate lyase